MITERIYHTDISITLEPIWFNKPPNMRIGINDRLEEVVLEKETTFKYSYDDVAGSGKLQLDFFGKVMDDTNTTTGQDTAIIIKEITFNGIANPRFMWAGIYYPIYPDWIDHSAMPTIISQYTYLGLNGKWVLNFELPIFTWIHKVENLGWIYD